MALHMEDYCHTRVGHIDARNPELLGSTNLAHIEVPTEKLEYRYWEDRSCGYNHTPQMYRIYNATHQEAESRDAVFIEAPSKLVLLLLVNETGNIDEIDNDGIISFHDRPTDGDVPRDVRDYT